MSTHPASWDDNRGNRVRPYTPQPGDPYVDEQLTKQLGIPVVVDPNLPVDALLIGTPVVADRRRRWQDYSDAEYAAALAATSDTKCAQCDHTKVQHFSAGPQCTVCTCPGFVVVDDRLEKIRTLHSSRLVQLYLEDGTASGEIELCAHCMTVARAGGKRTLTGRAASQLLFPCPTRVLADGGVL